MLYAMLARPIFTVARAIPMVRTTRPIGPFWRAKTCSTAARTFDHDRRVDNLDTPKNLALSARP
jgi:hypothetical protein